jgi:arsenite oxidase large subunit
MDGYHKNAKGGEFVTYERLRAMGTNGFQEPATAFQDGKIVGTKRLFADGKFGSKDGKAHFMPTEWRGLQAEGKQAEKDKFAFLINNGRANMCGNLPISTSRTTSSWIAGRCRSST